MMVLSSCRRSGCAAAGLACLLLASVGQPARADSDPRFDQFKDAASRAIGLKRCDLVQLRVGNDPSQPMQVRVPIAGQERVFNLHAHSVRGPNFHLLEQRADGKVYEIKAPPEVTVRGHINNDAATIVAGGVMPAGPEEGLHATAILADGTQYWIQPVSQWLNGAPRNLYAVYTHDDVLSGPWHCGNADAPAEVGSIGGGRFNDRGATLYTAQLSTDADFEYFARYGGTGQVNAKISTLLNIVDVQYERETDITMVLATQLVRTAEPDPYGSTDSNTLLSNFQNDWNTNRPGSRADLNQLFTGKEVDGNTIGLAFVGVVCGTSAYGIVQSDFNNNLMSATDLTAHESGHNWSATHCTCSGSGSTVSTMNPFITSINRFTFSNDVDNIAQIIGHRNSRGCLTTGGGGVDPRNNDCGSAVPVGPGLIGWNNAGATNDGPACGSFGADIWYTYVAPCDGDCTVNTCGSNHDTMLAVYTGFCGSLTQIGCNDDNAGCGGTGLQSAIPTFAVTRGTTYFIRLGGFNGATGDGLLSISQSFCPAPSNDSCGSAITVQQGDTPFSTIGASTDGPVETTLCNNASDAQLDNDVWFRYTAPCTGTVRVSTCSVNFDSKIAIYTGCPSTFNTAIACNDDNGPACSGTRSSVDFSATFGVTYLIRVGGYSNAVGSGNLNVTSLACPAPANDSCSNAIDVSAGGTFNATILGAGNDGTVGCGSATPDIWYSFTAPAVAGTLTATTCGTHDIGGVDAGIDTVLSIHTGCPGTAANQLACDDDWPSSVIPTACTGQDSGNQYDSAVQANLTPGQTVLIRLGRFSAGTPGGPVRLNISYAVGSGACCCGSTCLITTSAACTGSFVGAGSACNPAGNNIAPCCKADFNHSGAISVQDIFDFLAGYFSNNPCADPNDSGSISVQDIFDFLAAYFAGGC